LSSLAARQKKASEVARKCDGSYSYCKELRVDELLTYDDLLAQAKEALARLAGVEGGAPSTEA
jgi:hypothetical protein